MRGGRDGGCLIDVIKGKRDFWSDKVKRFFYIRSSGSTQVLYEVLERFYEISSRYCLLQSVGYHHIVYTLLRSDNSSAQSYKPEIDFVSRSVSRAVEYEVARQIHTLEAGGQVGLNT